MYAIQFMLQPLKLFGTNDTPRNIVTSLKPFYLSGFCFCLNLFKMKFLLVIFISRNNMYFEYHNYWPINLSDKWYIISFLFVFIIESSMFRWGQRESTITSSYSCKIRSRYCQRYEWSILYSLSYVCLRLLTFLHL